MSETKLLTPVQIQTGIATTAMPNLPELIIEATKDIDLILVDSKEKLPIANTRMEQINALLKHIETGRKAFKAPYITAGKEIEAKANSYKGPLEIAKGKLGGRILAFKKQEEAVMQVEQDEKRKKLEIEKGRKEYEAKLLDKIREQVNVKLFGGQYVTMKGTVVPCHPAQNIAEVTAILVHFSTNFPVDQFTFLKKDSEKAFKEIKGIIIGHQKSIANLVKEGKLEETLAVAKNSAETTRLIGKAKVEDTIEFEDVKQEKSMVAQLKSTTKGVRSTLTFTVVDQTQIQNQFLMVNEVAVNEYIRHNKTAILDGLEKGTNGASLPGIRFFQDSTYIA